MEIEKIEINGHYVWVDKDVEIKEGDLLYDTVLRIFKASHNYHSYSRCYKIIAASPEINLENVPTYVEWLAKKTITASEGVELEIVRTVWIHGFETAEKELFTEEDVRKAINMSGKLSKDGCSSLYTEEQIIKQLKKGGNK